MHASERNELTNPPTQLRRLQMVELDILKKFLQICEKYDLTYYMLGGTLLGAVRHQGFIPWDDDIDVGMPRPDYERFLAAATAEIASPYQLHTLQMRNSVYSYYYARLENTTIRLRRDASFQSVIIPAWIDVFPLDGVPNDGQQRKTWIKKATLYKKLFYAAQLPFFVSKNKSRSLPMKVFIQLFAELHLDRLINTSWAWKKLDRTLKKAKYDQSIDLINFCGYWGLKEMFPKKVYGKGRLYPFEDLMLNGPEDFDFVLTQMYGDYMTPPENVDKNHHYIEFL